MTELNFETKITHYVDAYALCRFLTGHLGKTVDYGESPNDTSYEAEIVAADSEHGWRRIDQEEIDEFIEDGYINCDVYEFGPALQWAADKGLLPYGNWVVRVCW